MSQFLVISQGKISGVASLHWMNMLFNNAFTDYGTVLTNVSTSPAMGWYLDNFLNRPKSAQCTWCEPNENFARELMELFSVGTTLINLDGSPKRDARGAKINTYTQSDVEAWPERLLAGNGLKTICMAMNGPIGQSPWVFRLIRLNTTGEVKPYWAKKFLQVNLPTRI
jgi:uncharacterized protein (DUF1800 family)